MSTEIVKLLQSWNFNKYIDVFIEHGVDIEALEFLDVIQIRTLIPSVGPQAKFIRKLLEWKLDRQKQKDKTDADDDVLLNRVVEYVYGSASDGQSLLDSKPSSPAPTVTTNRSEVTSSNHSDASSLQSIDINTSHDLCLLLKQSQDGNLLLKKSKEPLGDSLRKLLTRIIAQEILRKDPKISVTADIYSHWCEEISKVFPVENPCVYYTKHPDGARRPQGRLYDAVTNLKAKYRKNKLYEPRPRRSVLESNQDGEQKAKGKRSCLDVENVTSVDVDEAIEWLSSFTDNLALCEDKWQKTRSWRRSEASGETGLYLHKFPCLKRSWGYTLLLSDFHEWYPDNETTLEEKFPILKNKILTLGRKLSTKSTFLSELKDLATENDPETSILAALLLVPHLLGPIHVKGKKRSVAEVRDSFILNIKEEKLLAEEIARVRARSKHLNQSVQPYIIVVGPLNNISNRFVIIDDIKYELPSILKTVDTCFKIMWSLYLEYPAECLHVWQFLQRAIYNIPRNAIDPKEKIPNSVFGLLSDCELLNEKRT